MNTIITLTGNRRKAFALCEQWVARTLDDFYSRPNRLKEEIKWVVVDDGYIGTPITMGQTIVRPIKKRGEVPTIVNNLGWALEKSVGGVIIVEDDDWYAPDYLETQIRRLEDGYDLVGERNTVYHHVGYGKHCVLHNEVHSSLCATAMSAKGATKLFRLVEKLLATGQDGVTFVDIELWKESGLKKKLFDTQLCISMKGMPGWPGASIAHNAPWEFWNWATEKELADFIGDEDAKVYEQFLYPYPPADMPVSIY